MAAMKGKNDHKDSGIAHTIKALIVTCFKLLGIVLSFIFQILALILNKVADYLNSLTKTKHEHH